MNTKCDWCGCETGTDRDESLFQMEERCQMCPACVISILPKVLVTAESELEITGQGSAERRTLERLPVQTQVYFTRSNQAAEIIEVMLMDISDVGLKIILQEVIEPNEEVVIGFLAPDVVYKALATVKHVKKVIGSSVNFFEAGLRITGIHQELRL